MHDHIPDDTERPEFSSVYNFIKLSFREGYTTDILSVLNDAVLKRKWQWGEQTNSPTQSSEKAVPNIKLRTGIVGIERSIQEKQKANDESISLAFQDLNKLMVMAKDMVQISRNISAKIRVSYKFMLLCVNKYCQKVCSLVISVQININLGTN